MIKVLSVLLILAASPISFAKEPVSVYLGALSTHFGKSPREQEGQPREYTNTNPLLAVKYRKFVVGAFRNSFGNPSYFIGRQVHSEKVGNFSFGIAVGATYGYTACTSGKYREKDKFCFALVPEISYTGFKWVQPTIILTGPAASFALKKDF